MDISVIQERLQTMLEDTLRMLPNIGIGLAIFLVFLLIARGVGGLVRRLTESRHRHQNLGLVLGRLAQWGVIVLGLLIGVTIAFPSFTPANLIGALGVTGIAVGFAFRDIFENFLAGILILLTEPFRIDDQIIYGDYEGTVEDIQTRATTIKTYDGRRIVIPNAELYTNAVTVNTAFEVRRLQYDVGIGYGDDIRQAKQLMLEAVRGVDGVLDTPAPDVLVYDLAESSVTVRVRWWIKPPRRMDALDSRDHVLSAIKQTLTANGIDLPFPTRQILFHDQTEATDSDRAQQREGWPPGKATPPQSRSIARAIARVQDGNGSANGSGNTPGDGQ